MYFLKTIRDEILPFYSLYSSNKKIYAKLDNLSSGDTSYIDYMRGYNHLSLDQIKEYYNNSLESKKIIEEKIKTSLTSLTLSSAFIVAFANISISKKFGDFFSWQSIGISISVIFSVLYFVVSAIMAMNTIGQNNKIYRISPLDEGNKRRTEIKEAYAILTECNSLVNIIRQNYMSVSFNCIRNGIICIVIVPIFLLFSNGNTKNNINKDIQSTSKIINNNAKEDNGTTSKNQIINNINITLPKDSANGK